MKLVLAGPPRSGKSCLREGLKQAVKALPGAPYPYVITACPDGEGAWYQAAVEADPTTAAACKLAFKRSFTPEFVDRVSANVRNCALPLTIIDIGGIPSAENKKICAGATHILILSSDPNKVAEWIDFAADLKLTVLAVIDSEYHATEDVIPAAGEDGALRGAVHHLERGENVANRPTVQAIACAIIAQLKGAS